MICSSGRKAFMPQEEDMGEVADDEISLFD